MDVVPVLTISVISIAATFLIVLFWTKLKRNAPSDSRMISEFQTISQETLSKVSEQFLNLAEQRLKAQSDVGAHEIEAKKHLIDQQLVNMNTKLEQVSTMLRDTEQKRVAGFSALNTHLESVGKQTADLTATTSTLREALSSSRARGQWGERMAEDIIKMAGLVEGPNFTKQETVESVGTRPDFTFYLPNELRVNMDVKFPFDNYMKFLEEDSEPLRNQHATAFIRDVRNRIKELTSREYIDPEGGTVDYVILFIPNESIYSFIHETDSSIVDVAMESRVVCCSPFTLFAVLSVIRQAVDNFHFQSAARDITGLMGRFYQEWQKFSGSLDKVGSRLGQVQKEFDSVSTTRTRAMDRILTRIEDLRTKQGIPIDMSEDLSMSSLDSLVPLPDPVAEDLSQIGEAK